MQDSQILAACLADRKAWNKIHDHIQASDFTPTIGFWWKILADAYNRDGSATALDIPTLIGLGTPSIPSPKQMDTLIGAVSGLELPTSPLNVVQIAIELKRRNLTAEFAAASMGGDHKKATKLLAELNGLWDTQEFPNAETAEWQDARETSRLFDTVSSAQRIPFGCPTINAKLGGGLLPGHHVVIFGRTEIGKSSFVIDCVARLLKNKQRVLYIGNEDQIDILKLRLIGRTLKRTIAELESNPDRAAEEFKQFEPSLLMTQLFNGNIETIRKRVKEWKPSILVIDQFRNLSGDVADGGLTQLMQSNAIKLRALLLECGVIGISVTQANDRSERHGTEPPIFLQSGDVDSSRVGLPAQADLLLGIGANTDMRNRGQRFISICKNKLSSEKLAHEGVIVNFDLSISRVT